MGLLRVKLGRSCFSDKFQIKSHQISSDPKQDGSGESCGRQTTGLSKTSVHHVGRREMCFARFPWRPHRAAYKTIMTSSPRPQGHQNSAHPPGFSSIVALGGVAQPDVHPENVSFPIISGLLRSAKIGLASKGMTHGMTKLLCLSVRLGLYPTDICWLRLIQALEKPGIRVRHRWLFPLQFCLAQHSEGGGKFENLHPVFTNP